MTATEKQAPLVEEVYQFGRYTCYRITDKPTAWLDEEWVGKRLTMGWNVKRDEEGMNDAEREKGVVLLENELLDLKEQFESGEFAKLIETASAPGNLQQKIKLAGRIVTKTTVTITNLPIYGIMITFSRGKAFCKISIRRLAALMEKLGVQLNENI